MSTTITTHPITELEFPTVTVCPPRGSNTALNHLLEKVKDINFTKDERQKLRDISMEVFVEIPNAKHAKHMAELLTNDNMRSIASGNAAMPEVDNQGMVTIKSHELQGSFSTPGFDDLEYKGDFYSWSQSLHYVLAPPDNIEEMVGEGALVVTIESKGSWSYGFQEKELQLYEKKQTMPAAEELCASRGGHLASIDSQQEQVEIRKVGGFGAYQGVWLGPKRKAGEEVWEWLDGTTWGYQNWASSLKPLQGLIGQDCALINMGERALRCYLRLYLS